MNRTRNLLWTINKGAMEWIYHNSTLWLISIKTADHIWITISDKNLWATVLWNDGDVYNTNNVWNWYQWWNDYWFTWLSSWHPTYTTVQWNIWATQYSFSRATPYFNWTTCPYTWHYENLWWNNWTNKQWPCPTWYHIPTLMESWYMFASIIILWWTYADAYKIYHIPLSWGCIWNWTISNISALWTTWWVLTVNETVDAWEIISSTVQWGRLPFYPLIYIRPFKDTYVKPDSTWTRIL